MLTSWRHLDANDNNLLVLAHFISASMSLIVVKVLASDLELRE